MNCRCGANVQSSDSMSEMSHRQMMAWAGMSDLPEDIHLTTFAQGFSVHVADNSADTELSDSEIDAASNLAGPPLKRTR